MSLLLQHHLIQPIFKVTDTLMNSQQKSPRIMISKLKKVIQTQPQKNLRLLKINDQTIQSQSILDSRDYNTNSSIIQDKNYPTKFLNQSQNDTTGLMTRSKSEKKEFPAFIVLKTKDDEKNISQVDLRSYLSLIDSRNSNKVKTQQSVKNFITLLESNTEFKTVKIKKIKKREFPIITKRVTQEVLEGSTDDLRLSSKKSSFLIDRCSQDQLKFIRLDKQTNFNNKQARFQKVYDLENAEQIQQMKAQVHQLTKFMILLKEYLNNSRKFYQVVKNLIGVKKNLNKIVFQEQMESMHEPLTEENLTKGLLYKDKVYDKGDILSIEKWNFDQLADIKYLNQKTENKLLEIKLAKMNHMEENIITENDVIYRLNLRFQKGVKSLNQNDLRYLDTGMRKNMINDQIEALEGKLGDLLFVSKESRKINQCITAIIERMNRRDYM